MKIDVQMKLNEDMNQNVSEVAAGWVELEECIKFPVKVRRYMDKKEQKEKMFVSYPQRKKGNDYEGIVYPHDKKVREEIEKIVLDTVWVEVRKGLDLPSVEAVRVSLLEPQRTDFPIIRGIATLKLAGITISGITIKESEKGLFVQMPQYRAGGTYKDTVYGTNFGIRGLIKKEVLHVYEKEVEHAQKKELSEQPEQMQEKKSEQNTEEVQPEQAEKSVNMDRIFQAYEQNDVKGLLVALNKADLEIEQAEFIENGNSVKNQFALLEDGNRLIHVCFLNTYNPQIIPLNGELKQSVSAILFENGSRVGEQVLVEKNSKNVTEAEKNYQDVIISWKELTKQKHIGSEKKLKEKTPAPRV